MPTISQVGLFGILRAEKKKKMVNEVERKIVEMRRNW